MKVILKMYLLLLTCAYNWKLADQKVPSHLISGGEIVAISEAPFMAIFKNFEHRMICGAAIIHVKILLSAAHCNIRQDKKLVIAGTGVYMSSKRPLRGQYYSVKQVVNHPEADMSEIDDDICVIILHNKLRIGPLVKPIAMGDANLMPKHGEFVEVFGFGGTETQYLSPFLRTVALPYVARSRCSYAWDHPMPESIICAGGETGISTCHGDSGGPVVFKNQLLGTIVGSTKKCGNGLPVIITYVHSRREFIERVIKNNPDTQCAFKIRGGSLTGFNKALYVASFKLEDQRFTCAATIVDAQFLVSAAHCFYVLHGLNMLNNLTVTVGSNSNDDNESGEKYRVERIFVHPKFDYESYDYDIAVIKLKKKLPVELVKVKLAKNMKIVPGAPINVYGFAEKEKYPDSLHKLTLPYYDWRSCKNLYEKNTKFPITYQMFCAGEEGKDDTCAGDGGGPAIYNNTLLGIVSWGGEPCWRKYPSIFTSIPPLKQYIEEIIDNN